jgi:DNA primase
MPDFANEDYADYVEFNSTPKENKSVKASLAKLISLLLNHPSLADGTVEVRVRRIEISEILLEFVRSAEIDEDISQEDLIQPFKPKSVVYQDIKPFTLALS